MRKPIAVLISDIHFSVPTLELATTALKAAKDSAYLQGLPLVIAGDLTDGKAIIRGEVANRLLSLTQCFDKDTYLLVGNHDLLNEKGQDHALHFLDSMCNVISSPTSIPSIGHLIPYQTSTEVLEATLSGIPKGSLVIMHQGVQTAFLGHYVQDRTSLPRESFADFRVISGHYHRAQDIKCGRPRKGAVGLFSYIGNPYTLTFGEASDGPKGYQTLYDDGTLEQSELPLRRHRIWELTYEELTVQLNCRSPFYSPEDLLWIKISGARSELAKLKKHEIGMALLGHSNFKLDLIPTDSKKEEEISYKELTNEEVFDKVIDATSEKVEYKKYLKNLWREII